MTDIPESPAWELAQVKIVGSKSSLFRLQSTVDELARKARVSQPLYPHEKEFLKELFEAFGLGGRISGYAEASALVSHYVNGNGETLRINAEVYTSSVIVNDVMTVMKRQFQIGLNHLPAGSALSISSTSTGLLRRADFRELMNKNRDSNKRGRVLPGGWLFTEQDNQRLQKANNRFVLLGVSQRVGSTGNRFSTTWRVDDTYEFESFARGFKTHMKIRPDMTLVIPDGLSHHMTKIGLAKAFKHFAEWSEEWSAEEKKAN
jgi:hypothetical protein